MNSEYLSNISISDANYLVGFTDGEGSFNISFKIRKDYNHKVKITASFIISQKEKNILSWIRSLFNCGTIRARGDGVYYYEVTNLHDLNQIIVPFFKQYRLKTIKYHSFLVFAETIDLMLQGKHLTKDGILEIYDLRERIKVGRKRKHSRQEIVRLLNASHKRILRDYTPDTD